ncbi:hypothetical protein M436DRAFT_86485 [Aureobasidium namibiae CBS 147.97]|uniref:Uncharacterized protein n=1 Tax=Aureobasidium namibiae CBS 147.97 TaxID=1043004 RepID=A0A074WEP5_9PEZI
MPSGKPRLYAALYPSGATRGDEIRYHWALLVGPKNESSKTVPGMRHHATNPPFEGWKYEKKSIEDVRSTVNLLGRILIAKVEDLDRLNMILERVPVVQDDPNWRCTSWMASALEAIAKDGKAVGTSELDWTKIQEVGRSYVGAKTAAGRYMHLELLDGPRPSWDLLENKEMVA